MTRPSLSRTAVFDLDGTLVDSAPDLAAPLNRLLAAHDLAPHPLARVVGMIGDGARVLVARGFAAHGITLEGEALASATKAFLADYESALIVETALYPGVVDTLAALRAGGWRLAVCTNKPVGAANTMLQTLGVADFFSTIGGGDSFPTRKPDPAHLAATLAAMGASPERAVMIGDHHNDVAAARGCGVPAIWASWGYGPENPGGDAVAENFTALPALLDRLVPAVALRIVPGGLDDPCVIDLLRVHLARARAATAQGSAHALDPAGLKEPDITFWSGWDDQSLLAVGAMKRLSATEGEVKSMHTAQAARGQGVGAAMLRHIIAAARAEGLSRLHLETGSWDHFAPARALYARHGFSQCPPFGAYREDPNSVFMTLDLAKA
jgi:phosphoglycolate phosphatase